MIVFTAWIKRGTHLSMIMEHPAGTSSWTLPLFMPFIMVHATVKIMQSYMISSLPGQNGRHSKDDIFICIFMNEMICIMIKISLKFIPKGPIDNIPALV